MARFLLETMIASYRLLVLDYRIEKERKGRREVVDHEPRKYDPHLTSSSPVRPTLVRLLPLPQTKRERRTLNLNNSNYMYTYYKPKLFNIEIAIEIQNHNRIPLNTYFLAY